MTRAEEAAVAIIGGGFTGLSAALHLAERGVKVCLVEQGEIGHGASGRNNGQVIPHYTIYTPGDIAAKLGPRQGERLNGLVRDSAALVFDLIRRHDIDCDAVQNGWMQPAHSQSRVARSRLLARQWSERGANVEFLDRRRTTDMLGAGGYFGGWMAASGGHINPLAYARGLARAAARAGARIFVRSPALRVARDDGGWRVETIAGSIAAGKVLLATNAYTGALWPGLEQTIIPVRSYQIATRPLGGNVRKSIIPGNQAVSDTRGDLRFFRYDRDGRLVTGGGYVLWHNAEARARRSRERLLAQVFPALDGIEFDYFWDGLIAVTPDRLPRLFNLAPGAFAALAYSGRGVAFATAMGPVIADWLQGAPPEDLPLPVGGLARIPAHGLAKLAGRGMRLVYRWRDARD
ncbi:MAG TPA: FAD-binding oxidoreductase [Candidatus Cybelea sp.]|nr:FAD-binding oxidoreductase [Candidatus Cybelea sp.]